MADEKNKISVAVIVVSFNTVDLTRKALLALQASTVLPAMIMVVDNNSTDGSVGMVKGEFPEIELIESGENLGFARANNLALSKVAQEKYVWLLNSDTETDPRTLEQLFNYMENYPQTAGIVPQLVYPDGSWQSVGGYFPNWRNVLYYLLPLGYFLPKKIKMNLKSIALYPQEVPEAGVDLDYITGAAAFFRKSSLDQVGFLGEEYFMYFEETDLCWRLRQAGLELRAIKTDQVMHVYGGSFKKKHDPKRLRIFLESLEIFVRKNYPKWQVLVIVLEVKLFGGLSITLKSLKK